eukprot:scaffold58309_cov49-Attheya_sp.AAC.2
MSRNRTSGGGRGVVDATVVAAAEEVVAEEAVITGTRKTIKRGDQNIVPLVSSVAPKLDHYTANHANGGGSGKKSSSNMPKKSDDGDFLKKVALAIQGNRQGRRQR